MKDLYQPIIILGMHRSGTSLVSKILEELGVFIGWKRDKNQEALFFSTINRWLLRQSGGAWDNPEAIRYLLKNDKTRTLSIDYIKYLLRSPYVINYLGYKKYFSYKTPFNLTFLWGWKDPRNTFTLPIWLNIFPDARVIHVYRHGVDVACSLKVRVEKRLENAFELHEKRKRLGLYLIHNKKGGFTDTIRCTTLENGFSLWETYIYQANHYSRKYKDNFLQIKYENFVNTPEKYLEMIFNHCGLNKESISFSKIRDQIMADRVYSFKNDPELVDFANQVSERLANWGY